MGGMQPLEKFDNGKAKTNIISPLLIINSIDKTTYKGFIDLSLQK